MALAIHREIHSRRDEGFDLYNLAALCQVEGRDTEARSLFEEAAEVFREVALTATLFPTPGITRLWRRIAF